VVGEDGRRLATRHKARTLESIRESGTTVQELYRQLGLE